MSINIFHMFRKKAEAESAPIPIEEDGMKFIKFRQAVWMDTGLVSSYNNPVYYGIIKWCEDNTGKHRIVKDYSMGEPFLVGVYLLEEDIVPFKLVWGGEV